MTKKERLEYLEAEVAGLHIKLAEVIARLDNIIVIPHTQPGTIFPTTNTIHCLNCGQSYPPGNFHNCPTQWWNPNSPFRITYSGNSSNTNSSE